MLEEFIKYLENNRLVKMDDRVLLTVSGGIDSMAMSHLFIRAGIDIGIAHCNFTLRGEESDKDEELVREFAANHGIPFFSVRFETEVYAKNNGISIQMAARELRYTWFEEIRRKNGFNSIAVAHTLNDNIETFLINLIRGTGISGLCGIKKQRNNIIRPLLFATRQSIEDYCIENNIVYREDKSNVDIKYTRNNIRHRIIPLLKEINPSAEFALNEISERLSDINEIFTSFIEKTATKIFKKNNGIVTADIDKLDPLMTNKAVLFELFRPYGVNSGILNDLRNIIKGRTGGQLLTGTYRIIKNRNELIIEEITDKNEEPVFINDIMELRKCPAILSARIMNVSGKFRIPSSPDIACLDSDKITFPLILRKWEKGDFFFPLGMNHKKKLSDYFIDRKFPVTGKENARVLESGGNIVWIIGERIDDRFKITDQTKKVLLIKAQGRKRRANSP